MQYDQAVQAVKAKQYQKALDLLDQVVKQNPKNADAWNHIGYSHRLLKQLDQSYQAYQRALKLDPRHKGANEYLGELYLMMGQPGKAKERLKLLGQICFIRCEGFDDLKMAIENYEKQKAKR